VILFFIFNNVFCDFNDLYEYSIEDNSAFGFSYKKLFSDLWRIKGGYFSFFPLGCINIHYSFSAYYMSLGSFEVVESEGYAYRDVYIYEGLQYGGSFEILAEWEKFYVGANLEPYYRNIGGVFKDYQINGTGILRYESPIGLFLLNGGYKENTFDIEAAYGFYFYYEKIRIELFGGFENNLNQIIKAQLSLWNYRKDLCISVLYRYGLLYSVYDFITIGFSKKIENWECFIIFTPSLVDDNLVEIGVRYYFGESKM